MGGTGNWAPSFSFPGLSLEIRGSVACGAAWAGANDAETGSVANGANADLTTQLSTAALPVDPYYASLCVGSNDPTNPVVAIPITLDVVPSLEALAKQEEVEEPRGGRRRDARPIYCRADC